MPTISIDDPAQGAKEPSFEELASMIEGSQPAAEPVEEKATSEPKVEPEKATEEKTQKSESGTDKAKQQEEPEEELPPNVAKRIALEAKKQAFFQSKIDQAVSARKAKEAEAAKLTDKSGSEPAKTTESAKNERPTLPDRGTFQGTEAEFNAAVLKWMDDYQKWTEAHTRETVQRELTERQAKEAQIREWEAATAKYGKDFPALMDSLAQSTPVEFQVAVSGLEDWSAVAVHLAKNDDERNALVELFKASPVAAIAKLGKLEDRLKPAAKTASPKEDEPLPKPLKPIAGAPAGSNGKVDLDKATDAEALKEIERMLKAS